MLNPCIRSCLYWCERQITVTKPEVVIKIVSEGFDSAVYGLFTGLWKFWNASPLQGEVWMTQTEDGMGISSSELLFVLCKCIRWAWIDQRQTRLEAMRMLQGTPPDDFLAACVYKLYLARTSVDTRLLQEFEMPGGLDTIPESLTRFLRDAEPTVYVNTVVRKRVSLMQPTDTFGWGSSGTTLPSPREAVPGPIVPRHFDSISLVSSLETTPSLGSFKKAGKEIMRRLNYPEQDSASLLNKTVGSLGAASI